MKRAFFIIGPESSGTRFLTQCFIAAGCEGEDDWRPQRFSSSLDGAGDCIVYRAAWPPDAGLALKFLTEARKLGYIVHAVVIERDFDVTAKSQFRRRMARSFSAAATRVTNARKHIADFIAAGELPFCAVYYEKIAEPGYLSGIMDSLGLDGSKLPEFKDGNAKHLIEPESKPDVQLAKKPVVKMAARRMDHVPMRRVKSHGWFHGKNVYPDVIG